MIADRLQYADFAAWERETLRPDGQRYRDEVDWWRRAFEPERPALRLPFSRPTPVPEARPTDGVIHGESRPRRPLRWTSWRNAPARPRTR